ncbi:related to Chitin deacetylase precursor [Melanopsichium pennsylvanicum]|uniref:chitin deacetylase n=2 Tax=Melanopsichium pennsylvanicum TaxID=63383 RepID=A0AAJ4XKF5_9BASI|nr:related to Chitin deacetylase precursor [Melanopsichium pennsylvanicum 4]SNX84414.1 related to Chitin deacetylase precursor [Melanopsichium pennsylvanicum]
MKFTTSALVGAITLASVVSANIGRGVPDPHHIQNLYKRARANGDYEKLIYKRGSPAQSALKARATTEPEAAALTNPTDECTAYSLPEINAISSQFPEPWSNATILSGDTEAQTVWNNIKASGIIPTSITPKGFVNGDFSSYTSTYSSSDPDCWWTYSGCDTPKHSNIASDLVQCPEPDTWGLTFDDGPNCTHNAFYNFLEKNNQKATMFYIGSNVLDWPLEAQRGLVDGHHICVHTWSHQYMTAFPDEQVFAELYYTAKVIKDVIGVTPTCWRPPYGDIDDRVRAIAQGLGLESVLWTDDTNDWKIGTVPTASIDANYASIIAKETQGSTAGQGNIVLTHEINGHTMAEFMKQYSNIQAVFKHIVPLTACKNQSRPYPENITYPNFAQYIAGNINATGLPSGSQIKAANNSYNPSAAVSQTMTGTQTDGVASATSSVSSASSASSGATTTGATQSSSVSKAAQSSDKSGAMGDKFPSLVVAGSLVGGTILSAIVMLV